MAVATGPSPGSSTNAVTAADWVKGARIPANSADPRIARKGGYFRMANTTSSTSGSRLTAEMLNALPSASWAASVPTAPSGSAFSPRRKNSTRLIPSAGPAVQNMFLMCWPVVRPRPTSCGTRMVVSDRGVILSPK